MTVDDVVEQAGAAGLRFVRFLWCSNDGTVRAKALTGIPSDYYNAAWAQSNGTLDFVPIDAQELVKVTVGSGPLSSTSTTTTAVTSVGGSATIFSSSNDGTSCAPAGCRAPNRSG